MNAHYLDVARLMARIARNVFADGVFAPKGGTGINLFVRDLPRLSVDLNLVFVDHTLPRAQALAAMGSAFQAIADRLKKYGIRKLGCTACGPASHLKSQSGSKFGTIIASIFQRSASAA